MAFANGIKLPMDHFSHIYHFISIDVLRICVLNETQLQLVIIAMHIHRHYSIFYRQQILAMSVFNTSLVRSISYLFVVYLL